MGEFCFDTGLSEAVASRTRLAEHITESGILAVADGEIDGTDFTFCPYSFNEARTVGEGSGAHVVLCGDEWGASPLPLTAINEDAKGGEENGEDRRKWTAAMASLQVVRAVNALVSGDGDVPPVAGAGGVFVSSDLHRVLFMPSGLFDMVASLNGEAEYARLVGVWQSKALLAAGALREGALFMAACIAYCALTGKLPYGNTDETVRDADIYDRNYLPLELSINGVSEKVARLVDAALDAPSVLLHKKDRGDKELCVEAMDADALRYELGLGGEEHRLQMPLRTDAVDEDVFRAKVASYYKTRAKRIKASRVLRRNKAVIIGAAAAVVIVAVLAVSHYRDSLTRPTMTGLTSGEVTRVFYKALDEQDVQLLTTAARGKVSHNYGDNLSEIFVTGKMRGMYESGGIITMKAWCDMRGKGNVPLTFGVYGITRFALDGDGDTEALDIKVPLRRDKLPPVTQEGSTVLCDGTVAVHRVSYYFVHTEGEDVAFMCEHHTDTVTLTYAKGSWRVTDVQQDVNDISIDTKEFLADFAASLAEYDNNVPSAVARLADKYAWLPVIPNNQ